MSLDLIARTVRGIEYVAAEEIASVLSPARLSMQPRQVVFTLDKLDRRSLDLRTIDDLFLSVGSGAAIGHRKDELPRFAAQAARSDWAQAVEVVSTLRELPARRRFDVVASLLGRRNYSRFDVEDAVGAELSGRLGAEYVSRRGETRPVDHSVRVFVDSHATTYALRLAAAPLHRRQYKQDASRGTLHPPMAAALARLLSPRASESVLDPFCGDGTIPIEVSALSPDAAVRGTDIDPTRIHNAISNADRAGVRARFEAADAGTLQLDEVDVLITNPPWSLAVEASGSLAQSLAPLWDRIARSSARVGLIMAADLAAADTLESRGYQPVHVQQVRLAGRLSHLVLCAPPGRPLWTLPAAIAEQRDHAMASGLITESGFASA